MKIDTFAHILPKAYYQTMLKQDADIPHQYPFIKIPSLMDAEVRITNWPRKDVKEVISFANINAEDYFSPDKAAEVCHQANQELSKLIQIYSDYFINGVGMLALNNSPASCEILKEIADSKELVGAQIFTRYQNQTIFDPKFRPIFEQAAELGIPIWLDPVFDKRKPDNNLVFSWEYELSQAMLGLVQENIFEDYPDLKIIVHHAGAMVPYFAGRIRYILGQEKAKDFKKFYVDTAILGNPDALRLAINYYGIDHVLFGTDAPFAVKPVGATDIVIDAIDKLNLSDDDLDKLYYKNYEKLISKK